MKMKHATGHYYPNDNKQALDLVGLSFFIALALAYIAIVGIKLVKRLPLFRSSSAKHQQEEGYRLADFDDDDDYEARVETLNKRLTDLHIRLSKAEKLLHAITVVGLFVLITGLYLGARSIGYGMSIANKN
ncbi:hypothetical protein D0Z00_003537 [Geotrichum galactomycetum]|uniref:Uncharacterized protein n=1 Tax=Geotrichum galactomycetum TaxID=27317 RepID=A0ACB6V0X7_9ASCO|nr:hypothetical protein D0Z00_003537 [Geotrichum candidum]